MRGPGAICRLPLACVTQSLFFLSTTYPCSICAHAAIGDPAGTWDFGRHAVLRDRRGVAVSQHTERDAVLRPAVVGGDGHPADRDSHRAAALLCEPGLRLPARGVSAFERILHRAGSGVTDCNLRLLGSLQHMLPGRGGTRP